MRDKCVEMSDNANKMRDRLVGFIGHRTTMCESIADHLLANGGIALPCKVGDTVYQVDTLFDETTITELKVIELTIDSNGIKTLYGTTNKGSAYCFDRGYNLNNIKFTKEEAERALKGGEK